MRTQPSKKRFLTHLLSAVSCVAALVSTSAHAALIVRPGTFIDGCTVDFVFDGSDGGTYMGTAGHCFLVNGQAITWTNGTGPTATVNGQVIGRAVYAIWNQNALDPLPEPPNPALPLPADFALIRLDPSVQANPQVCHFGGPTGVNTASDGAPIIAHYFGEGEISGSIQETRTPVSPARTGIVTGSDDPRAVALHGAVGPGDSGFPVIDDQGRAIGLLSHIGSPVGSSIAPVSRLEPHVAAAEAGLGIEFDLRTAPLIDGAAPLGSDC